MSGDRRGGGPSNSGKKPRVDWDTIDDHPGDIWETMEKELRKSGQAVGRGQRAPGSSSSNAAPTTARQARNGNGSSRPSGNNWAQPSDRRAAARGNPRPPPQTKSKETELHAPHTVVTPPLAHGWQRASRSRPSGPESKKDDVPSSGCDHEMNNAEDEDALEDDNDDMSDDISDYYDSNASKKSFETRKRNEWFKSFFEALESVDLDPAEEIPETRQKRREDLGKSPTPNGLEPENNSSDADTEEASASDDDMREPAEQQINLRTITADEYAIMRHQNQFVLPKSSQSPKFHTNFQELVYEQLYGQSRQFADHKWVNWSHLNSLDKYEGTYRLFQRAGIHDLVTLKCDYDEEIIRQFYATIYVSPDFNHLAWMTGTVYLDCPRSEFELALRTESGNFEKIYDKSALLVPAWTEYYDENVRYTPGKIGGLLPIPSLVNRIINHTILPKSGNFDAIRGHVWNIIDNIMHGRKFDVIDVILREIGSSKNDRVKRINYAPYIMALIIRKTGYNGGLGSVHKAYKPREGPPIPAHVRSRAPQRQDLPRQDTQRHDAQDEGQVSLSQVYATIMEIKNTQQKMQTSQQEFQLETNNRLAALTESVTALEQAILTRNRYGRRRRHTPLRGTQDPTK